MHAAVIPVLAQLEIISPNLTAAGQSLPRIIADLRHVSGCSGGFLFLLLCSNPNVIVGGSGGVCSGTLWLFAPPPAAPTQLKSQSVHLASPHPFQL